MAAKQMKPYIGVAGLMARSESEALIEAWREAWKGGEPTHDLALGALVSSKTLAGEQNRHPLRYQRIDDVAGIFVDAPGVVNLVHYASDEAPGGFEIGRLVHFGGGACHGFQFNVTWPEVPTLLALKSGRPKALRIVLQAGPRLLAECGAGAALSWKLKPYDHAATDVLIDASGGRGVSIDVHGAAWVAQFVLDQCPGMGIVLAGGLCAEAIASSEMASMLRAGCSADAESKLRTAHTGGGHMDLSKAIAFLRAAVRVLREAP